MVTVLLTVLIFGILIFVHELGHFLACRIFGVRVNEFAIGMGPKLFSVKSEKSGTVYSLRVLPIGGFNNIEDGSKDGDEDGEGDSEQIAYEAEAPLPPDSFLAKSVWKRMIIILAGSFMNLLLGFIIMAVVVLQKDAYASTTFSAFYDPAEMDRFASEGLDMKDFQYSAEYKGLKVGDKVIKVGGRRVFTGEDIAYNVFQLGGGEADFTVLRDGKKIVVDNVQFPTAEAEGITFGRTNFYVRPEDKNFVNTVKQAFFGGINYIVQVYDSIVGMVTGKYGIQHMSGPIGVGEVIGQAAGLGFAALLSITVLLAMNLGVFNLLPIPGLDGGKFIFLLIEAIIRRPLPKKVEEYATMVGMFLLFGLVFIVMFKDIFAIFR